MGILRYAYSNRKKNRKYLNFKKRDIHFYSRATTGLLYICVMLSSFFARKGSNDLKLIIFFSFVMLLSTTVFILNLIIISKGINPNKLRINSLLAGFLSGLLLFIFLLTLMSSFINKIENQFTNYNYFIIYLVGTLFLMILSFIIPWFITNKIFKNSVANGIIEIKNEK